jgi:hypothetical protein
VHTTAACSVTLSRSSSTAQLVQQQSYAAQSSSSSATAVLLAGTAKPVARFSRMRLRWSLLRPATSVLTAGCIAPQCIEPSGGRPALERAQSNAGLPTSLLTIVDAARFTESPEAGAHVRGASCGDDGDGYYKSGLAHRRV